MANMDPWTEPKDDKFTKSDPFSYVVLGLVPRTHSTGFSDELPSEARSAEASATARRTKCAPAERSRQAAGVSEINPEARKC